MYSPKYYREERLPIIYEFIQNFNFATILTDTNTDLIGHLPFLLSFDKSEKPELVSHFARANPQWRQLQEKGFAKLIFNGPHGYISPQWYQPSKDNVPTWNYAIVHVKGKIEIIEDPSMALQHMNEIVNQFESNNNTTWRLPTTEEEILKLMNSIVVFKVTELQFEAKFKLSQIIDLMDRENIVENLSKNTKTNTLFQFMMNYFNCNS